MSSCRFRRRLTSAQRQRLLARYHQSQFTQREFAERHSISHSALVKWLQQERAKSQVPVSFQEVVLPNSAGRWALEVVHPRGWTVRLAEVGDVEHLSQLLGALPC
jgi:transposase-like protein